MKGIETLVFSLEGDAFRNALNTDSDISGGLRLIDTPTAFFVVRAAIAGAAGYLGSPKNTNTKPIAANSQS